MTIMTTAKFKIESGEQLLARITKKNAIENFYPALFECGLNHGDTVEIFSDTSTSYLLIDLICEALFPTKSNEEPSGVLMFNTVSQFIYEEFIKTIKMRIDSCLDNSLDIETRKIENDRLLNKALSNFFLLEIYDATQFYTTIHNLDSIFTQHSNISLLVFDTLTAFYWSEQGFKIMKMDLYIKNLLRIIQKVSKEYKVIIVYTRPGYFSSSKDMNNYETSQLADGLNFKVQLVDSSKGVYQLNVRTVHSYYTKCFIVLNNVIKWQ
ncbi:X-ray repair cross complementing 2 [Anticarsia gemmatalis]|uniref:X-ray repair cross complementing 2 n=1 Tax=Anticarsia gemmatalis TaxID=129554 RepID=UPI003F7774E4